LDRLKTTVITAFVIALICAPAAFAQSATAQAAAAKVEVVSGNGQLICTVCATKLARSFYPMVVRVVDANDNPISGKTVTWALVTASGGLPPSFDTSTTTDSNGLSFSRPFQSALQGGTAFQPFLQSVISATADTATVNFTETLALTDTNSGNLLIQSTLVAPNGNALTGPAGTKGLFPIVIHLAGAGTPVPGVSLRILSPEVTSDAGVVTLDPTLPSASCYTDNGADPGSVLTNTSGDATCYPVFGSVAGSGTVSALVGGLDPIEFDQTASPLPLPSPVAFDQFSSIQVTVTQLAPGQIIPKSGNNQTVNPGQASQPLVVQVTDQSGAVFIGNQNVVWTVMSGAATVSPTTSTTDSTGTAQTIVTFSPSATGQIVVRAALTGSNSGITTAFYLSTRVLISGIIQVSGNGQTTPTGQNFPLPLTVEVLGTNNQPLPSQTVSFQVTGAATLSTLSDTTDATGQAHVTVTAGSTAGTVTVQAFVGTFSLSSPFTLTVIPPGPALISGSFYNAGGLTRIGALSPCSLVTVIASGLAPNLQGMVYNASTFGPWATKLANDTVTVASVPAPIFSVGNVAGAANGAEQLTFQVPCETAPGNSVPITINVGGGSGTITFPVVAASPGIFETVMSDGARRAVVIRPDGTFVSLENPARRGETVRVIATGLGPTSPLMVTGSVPVPGVDSLASSAVIVGVNNGGTHVIASRVSPNLIGVYEVTFTVPSDAPTGNDVVLNIVVNALSESVSRFSNGSKIPIQ
jgi:adhesin/invasin